MKIKPMSNLYARGIGLPVFATTKPEKKIKVILGKLIKKTSGGFHGWYESNVGIIRKPIQKKG